MNADQRGLIQGGLTDRIIGVFFDVYNELGHGFLESVYEEAMSVALAESGMAVERQVPVRVFFRGSAVGEFRAVTVVSRTVLLEYKAARAIDAAHEKQLLNYLRATAIEVGLLLNFGVKPEFKRFVYENARKQIRVYPR